MLRFHPNGPDTMLSALSYSDSELGAFDSGGPGFGGLDGLLGAGGAVQHLLDQEAYMETDLSPQAYSGGDTFSVRENSPIGELQDNKSGEFSVS